MKNDVEYPALEATYDGTDYWLTDGFHRYYALKQLGVKTYSVEWVPGTLQDAIRKALSANSTHGMPRTREDKIKCVQTARGLDEYKEASYNEIAKICAVSASFVAAVLDPKIAEKQKENKDKADAKRLSQQSQNQSSTTPEAPPAPSEGMAPSAEELAATELALQADVETMHKLLEADDKLAEAYKIIEQQNLQLAQLELRFKGIMNEKNELVKLLKEANKTIDKLRGK
jgi:hypothetical protein